MGYLVDPKETIAVLNKYNFMFRKKFGQNFLIDQHVLDKIIAAAGITKDDLVLEIGPGIGTLTQYLCESAGQVVAVEIDRDLIPILENDTLKDYDNLTIINDDVLKVNLRELANARCPGKRMKVVANLPYYITTPIIMKLLEERLPIENITVMVQEEVAERMQAGPGTKDYGALSLAVSYFAEPYIAAKVPQNCFMPRPNVSSAVIRLTLHEEPQISVRDEKFMFSLIRASFNHRRKTLVNGLVNDLGDRITRDRVLKALAACNFKETVRGEELTLPDFAKLSEALYEN